MIETESLFISNSTLYDTELIMFGTVLRVVEAGAFVLINEKCYRTDMQFIPTQRIESLCLAPGRKIYFDNDKVFLCDYYNCKRCHKSLKENEECSCDAKTVITSTGVLTKKETKSYPTGIALKTALQCGDRILNAVIFENSALYCVFNALEQGETVHFKAIIVKNGDNNNDLGKIFHARKYAI